MEKELMSQKDFFNYIEKHTNKKLGTDYSLIIGSIMPFKYESISFSSSALISGFNIKKDDKELNIIPSKVYTGEMMDLMVNFLNN